LKASDQATHSPHQQQNAFTQHNPFPKHIHFINSRFFHLNIKMQFTQTFATLIIAASLFFTVNGAAIEREQLDKRYAEYTGV